MPFYATKYCPVCAVAAGRLFSEISRNKHGRFTTFWPYRKGTKMDLRKLKKLIDLVEESGIAEIEVTEGEEKVRITRATAAPAPVYAAPAQVAVPAPAPAAAPAADETDDIVNTLIALGYNEREAKAAIKGIPKGTEVGEGVRLALKNLLK